MFGIDYLLSPHGVTDFLDNQYGKKALLVPGADDKFAELFGWEEINQMAQFSDLGGQSARLVHDKHTLPPESVLQFNQWIREGATFVINNVQTKDPVIDQFARILGAELNTPINVNCYVSAPTVQGFDTHYDRHDVFIVHLAGEKTWHVFQPTLKWPLEVMTGPKGEPPKTDPYLECTLTPGDMLYIPRGHWHHALSDTPCIHLTVGPRPCSGIDFLYWLLDRLKWQNEFLRQDFPVAECRRLGGRRSDAALSEHVSAFQSEVTQILNAPDFEDVLTEFFMTHNFLTRGPSAVFPDQQTIYSDITDQTQFRMPVGQKVIPRFDADENRAEVLVRGHRVILNGITRELLEALFDGTEVMSGAAIMAKCSNGASWENVKKILLTLMDHGVLTLVPRKTG